MFISKVIWKISNKKNVLHPLLKNYQESQYWPRHQIRQFQWEKIRKLLNHAYENVPYYRKIFDEYGVKPTRLNDFNDLKRIPILTKETIKNNFSDLMAKNISQTELIENATGGSTGVPLQFYHDKNYRKHSDVAQMRAWQNVPDYRLGDVSAVLWGDMKDIKSNYSLWERLNYYIRRGEIPMNAFHLSRDRNLEFARWCRLLKPKVIRAYVTAIKEFAGFAEENHIRFPGLKGIILGAETVNETSRSYIEKIFKTKTFNSYGSRELSGIAMECAHGGLHQIAENNYVEYKEIQLGDHDNAGELVITNLNNYAMPFIRYRIGDIGIPSDKSHCPCGRGAPMIEKVIGRTTEVFRFYDGTVISGEMFIHLIKDFPVSEYQFVQTSPSNIDLWTKKADKLGEVMKKEIRNLYEKYLPDGVNIRFAEKDNFEKTATGKFRFVKVDDFERKVR